LGTEWTHEVQEGWSAVFKFITKGMQAGAAAEVEALRIQRRETVKTQSATLRLLVISKSEGTSKLTRSRFQDSDRQGQRSGRNQPPRLPTRHSRDTE